VTKANVIKIWAELILVRLAV